MTTVLIVAGVVLLIGLRLFWQGFTSAIDRAQSAQWPDSRGPQ